MSSREALSLTFPILLKKPLLLPETQNVVLTAAQLITCNFHSLESEYLLSLYIATSVNGCYKRLIKGFGLMLVRK